MATESESNDWFGENEDRDHKEAMRRKKREMLLDPPAGVERGSWIAAGIIIFSVIALVVGAVLIALLKWAGLL